MTTTPRLATGRSSEYAQDDASWLKSFFSAQGLLPKTKIFEDLATFRAPDYSNLNGASAPSRSRSRAKFTSSSSPANWGWDLGASYSKVLFIVGMLRTPGGVATSSFLTVGKTLPATTTPKEHYFWGPENSSSRVSLYRSDATPTTTLIASDANINPNTIAGPDGAYGIYVDAVAHVQVCAMALGGRVMYPPIADQADANISGTVLRYVGLYFGGAPIVTWAGCPVIAYAA